jgi:hypothetical protein
MHQNNRWFWKKKMKWSFSAYRFFLRIHHFILMINTFHVHGIKIFNDKFFAQPNLLTFLRSSFYNFIPPGGLQNGDIVRPLILTNLFSYFHSLTEYLHQFIIGNLRYSQPEFDEGELGTLDEALVLAREGLPLCRENGSAWASSHHLALRTVLASRVADGARLAGYAEHIWALKEGKRPPIVVRAREMLLALLHEKLAADELERLLAEGAKMSENEVWRVALEQ